MISVNTLARRGAQHVMAFTGKDSKAVELDINIPAWGIAVLVVTFMAYFVIMQAIEYVLGHVIPTLIIVESKESALLVEPLQFDEPDASLKKEPEVLLLKQQPITSSWRRAISHLRSRGGFWAPFRGLSIFFVYNMCLAFVAKSIDVLPFVPRGTAVVLALILLANMNMAWTHIVISDPSPLPWFKRLPSFRKFKKIAGPTAIYAIAQQLSAIAPAALAMYYGAHNKNLENLEDFQKMTGCEKKIIALQVISVLALALLMGLFVVIPAKVVLTRVQASLLSDSEETIVPCDRSFNGKVVPEIIGGSGVLGIRDAWKTFECSSWIRLVRAYVKVFTKQLAVTFFFFAIITAELFLIVGKSELKKLAPTF